MIACFRQASIGITVEWLRNPNLREAPLALVGTDHCIAVACELARNHGIRRGQALAAARSLCPSLKVLEYDTPAYRKHAEAAWNALAEATNYIEPVLFGARSNVSATEPAWKLPMHGRYE
jgi:nucleotidyltransferase/DNA polymerase involved in DNA repair